MEWDLQGLTPLSYDFIMADPPWRYENWSKKGEHKNASAKYTCVTTEEIKKFPVGQLAQRDCVLWLWATNPMLPQAIDVLKAWGFDYVTAGHWVKHKFNQRTQKRSLAFGTGYCLRSAGEPFLIGRIGKPKYARNVRSIVEGLVREHSRKPEEAYAAAEALCPDACNRLDLFSRQIRPGWHAWGNEIHKFPSPDD